MLGGAGGDSLGAAVEFLSIAQIRNRYGPLGVQDLQSAFGLPPGLITDDTQQAVAVARGLSLSQLDSASSEAVRRRVWSALKDWQATQSDPQQNRSPGGTSMGSLRGTTPGSINHPLNSSNSCGSVMRVHPVGIAYACHPEEAFWIGMEVSVLTHGGAEAITAGGFMAALISLLCSGETLEESLARTSAIAQRMGVGTLPVTARVLSLPTDETLRIDMDEIGQGWDADSALAMGIYAARCFPHDYLAGVQMAVNHSGDSDSTGSMAGAILGAIHGLDAIPRSWRDRLEGSASLMSLARTIAP